jgi:hypothetical protein
MRRGTRFESLAEPVPVGMNAAEKEKARCRFGGSAPRPVSSLAVASLP